MSIQEAIIAPQVAEQATGCVARVPSGGQLYDGEGNPITDHKAREEFREGNIIEAPNAGAGSYRYILQRLGFKRVEVNDWTSSAGDWSFIVQGGRIVFQENRYPHCGFRYSMDNSSPQI